MKWFKRLLIGFALFVVILAAVPYFLPLSTYIPLIESTLSEKLRQPVTIGGLQAVGMPLPHLLLQDVRIGKPTQLAIRTIKVVPELPSLLNDVKVLSLVELDGVAADESMLAVLSRWLADDGSPQAVRLKRIKMNNGLLHFENTFVGPLNSEANLTPEGTLESAQLGMADGSLSVNAKPGKKYYLLDVSAKNWNPPLQPGLRFDALTFQGRVDANEMFFNQINAKIFGGSVTGSAHLTWRKQWLLAGELNGKDLEIKRLAALLKPQVAVSGKLIAKSKFSMASATPALLAKNPTIDMDFQIQDGVLRNIDIEKAVKSAGKSGVQGGETRFEHFAGKLHLEKQTHQLRELSLDSGMLNAAGALDIAPDKKLSGIIHVQLKGSANLVGIPLAVGGTLQAPTLRPTTGTMTGAAVGTLLLGPGMGTSLGMRAGQWIEKLFGKKGIPASQDAKTGPAPPLSPKQAK